MYSNFGMNITIYIKEKSELVKKIKKIKRLIPETNISTNQQKKTSKVCPISGCVANNELTIIIIKKVKFR